MSFQDLIATVMKYLSDFQYFIAGLFGATVSTRYNREQLKTPFDYLVFILSGALTAHYLTQLIMRFLPLEAEHAGGIGFLTGAIGGLILQELIEWIKSDQWKKQNFFAYLLDMFKKWLERGRRK